MHNWTVLQIRTLVLCFILNMLDGADVLVVSFVAPVLTQQWAASDAVFGMVFSAGLAGMTLGALFLAPIADRRGRRELILLATAVIALGMLASALAASIAQLAVLRFLTGLGIGAMLASVTALASEYAPAKYRSFAVTMAIAGYPAGATLAGLAGSWIIPTFGWQGMFILMGLGSAIIFPIVFFALPESVQFLIARQPPNALARANHYLEAQQLAPLQALPPPAIAASRAVIGRLIEPDLRLATLLSWGAFFSSFFTLYFLTSWIPRIAIEAGYPLAVAINGSTAFNVGAFLGLVLLGWFASRMELATLIGGFFTASAVIMVAFGAQHTPQVVFFAGMLVIGFLVQGGFGGLYAIAARIYPTEVKTTGVGWSIGIGRLGAVAGPAVGGFVIGSDLSVLASFIIFAIPMVIAAVLTLLVAKLCLRPETHDVAAPNSLSRGIE
jgi:AAHS family 4-hydroxybenzoate transporter-like MFS transporter